ncbi:DUF4348 domain-containing protein [Prevotella koreensis]
MENRKKTKDDFVDFIEKFSSDSVFQKKHISYPLKVSNVSREDDETNVSFINEKEWLYNNICDTEMGGEEVNVKINKKNNAVEVRGKESGLNIDFLFKKVDDQWLLYEIADYSM